MSSSIELNKGNMSLYDQFMKYCEDQSNRITLWFLLPLMTLAGGIMPVIITVLILFDLPGFLIYVGLSVPLFFINIVAHIAEAPTKLTIPLYLATIVVNILFPIIMVIIETA